MSAPPAGVVIAAAAVGVASHAISKAAPAPLVRLGLAALAASAVVDAAHFLRILAVDVSCWFSALRGAPQVPVTATDALRCRCWPINLDRNNHTTRSTREY